MYLTRTLQTLHQQYPDSSARSSFIAHLFEAADRVEKDYCHIMARHDGDPRGIEFRHVAFLRWAIVLPDASEPGRTRIQYFTPSGFDRHRSFATLEEAVEEMVSEGYVVEQPRMLDSLAVSWRAKQRALEEKPEMVQSPA